jgi:RNA polymerase sigma factor (sigma-70 family)
MSKAICRIRDSLVAHGEAGQCDGQLLERFLAERDEAAFANLVRRHGPMVLGVCGRILRHPHDAEDAFQATFLVLARKAASVVPRQLVGHWLYGVAFRTALRARSSALRHRSRERQVIDMPDRAAPAKAIVDDLRPVLDEEMNRLPEIYRVPLVLCELEGRTKREAATALGVPEGTVASRLARGRVLLRKHLTRRGLAVTSASLTLLLSQNASAVVPANLLASTVRTALSYVPTQAATAGLVSARILALSEVEITHMLLSKLRVLTWLMVVLLAAGAVAVQTLRADIAAGQADPTPPRQGDARPGAKGRKPETLVLPAGISVDAICWGRDGKYLVTQERTYETQGGQTEVTGYTLLVRDAQTGKLRKTLLKSVGKVDYLHDVAISPDGKSLAAIHREKSDTAVLVWDTATWNGTKILKADTIGLLLRVVWSPDGRYLAASGSAGVNDGGQIAVWDVKTDKLLWIEQVQPTGDIVSGLAFSSDGKLLASANRESTIKIWDAATGKEKKTLVGHGDEGVYSLAFSRDGLLVSGGLDGTVRLWDLETGKPKRTVKVGYSKRLILQVAFSPDGRFLATAGHVDNNDNSTSIIDTRTWEVLRTFPRQKGGIRALTFSSDGATVAVGGWNSHLVLLPVNK